MIVGVGGSPSSFVALRRAIEVALDRNARLMIVVAAPLPSGVMAMAMADAAALATVMRQREVAASESLSAALRLVPSSLPVTTRLCFTSPFTALRACSDGPGDLVVVGQTYRRGTMRGALRRSIGARLLRDPAMRVLVVPSGGLATLDTSSR